MRLDPKTRFLIDYIARARGQNLTTVIERAITEAANQASGHLEFGEQSKHWQDIWHTSEGARSLTLWAEKALFPNYEEEYKLAFARTHWPFFYNDSSCKEPKVWSIDVLWPRIDEFVEMWREKQSTDYFAVGREMQEALRAAGLKAPDWPVQSPKPQQKTQSSPSRVPDDEIPF